MGRAHYLLLMDMLTADEGTMAVKMARNTIEAVVHGRPVPSTSLPPVFSEKRGIFVTITRSGELRGCIGYPYPVLPLKEAIPSAATGAALEDPRFPPVPLSELDMIRVEVTVLTPPEPLGVTPEMRPHAVTIGKHGLIARSGGRSGLLLPQVATEYSWNCEEFLSHTCMKAGLPANCWKRSETEILTFEGQIFHEQVS
jgi:uncharacterized protein (TIGR00296 family)